MDVLDPECEGCGKRICVCPRRPNTSSNTTTDRNIIGTEEPCTQVE